MPTETGTTISNLKASWPLSSDPILEGDNHIRLIKSILASQFPGEGGLGFSKPITATEDEINYLSGLTGNYLSGLTGNIQYQIDAILDGGTLPAPSGTVMLFRQSSPPVGWVAQIDVSDHMLRAVAAGGGIGLGGTDSPITFSATHTHSTSNTTLTIDQIPSHTHTINADGGTTNSPGPNVRFESEVTGSVTTQSAGGGNAHNHGNTSEFIAEFNPKYVDVIIAVKS